MTIEPDRPLAPPLSRRGLLQHAAAAVGAGTLVSASAGSDAFDVRVYGATGH